MALWFFYENGSKLGPFSMLRLKEYAANGRITRDTIVEIEKGRASKAGNVTGLFPAPEVAPENMPEEPEAPEAEDSNPESPMRDPIPDSASRTSEVLWTGQPVLFSTQMKMACAGIVGAVILGGIGVYGNAESPFCPLASAVLWVVSAFGLLFSWPWNYRAKRTHFIVKKSGIEVQTGGRVKCTQFYPYEQIRALELEESPFLPYRFICVVTDEARRPVFWGIREIREVCGLIEKARQAWISTN